MNTQERTYQIPKITLCYPTINKEHLAANFVSADDMIADLNKMVDDFYDARS